MPRFARPGKSKIFFATAVANPAAPTRAEINAATVLITDFRSATGFASEQTRIPMPDYVSSFTPSLAGRTTAGNPTLTFYDQDAATNGTRTALAEGTNGFILRMPYGDVAGRRMETWPATIGALNDSDWGDGDEAAQYAVAVSITSAPSKNAVVPA